MNPATTRDAAELLTMIAAGRDVTIATYTRAFRINARCAAAFARTGRAVLKNGTDGHLYMASGRSYVDAHFANVFID